MIRTAKRRLRSKNQNIYNVKYPLVVLVLVFEDWMLKFAWNPLKNASFTKIT